MGLIKFLFHRKKETSLLAVQKYGEHKVDPKDLDLPLLHAKDIQHLKKEKN